MKGTLTCSRPPILLWIITVILALVVGVVVIVGLIVLLQSPSQARTVEHYINQRHLQTAMPGDLVVFTNWGVSGVAIKSDGSSVVLMESSGELSTNNIVLLSSRIRGVTTPLDYGRYSAMANVFITGFAKGVTGRPLSNQSTTLPIPP